MSARGIDAAEPLAIWQSIEPDLPFTPDEVITFTDAHVVALSETASLQKLPGSAYRQSTRYTDVSYSHSSLQCGCGEDEWAGGPSASPIWGMMALHLSFGQAPDGWSTSGAILRITAFQAFFECSYSFNGYPLALTQTMPMGRARDFHLRIQVRTPQAQSVVCGGGHCHAVV